MKAIVNGSVYTPTRIVPQGVVLFEGERIVAVGTPKQIALPEGTITLDAGGAIVCPGLVDIHLHGGDGADCSDGTPEAVRSVARRHLRAGTTSLLATTASAPLPEMWQAFEAIRRVMGEPGAGEARVLGIHMEGNFFAAEEAGSHAPELLRMPTPAERERLLGYSDDLRRVTIAPEREGALALIRDLSARGVLVAGGHSAAFYADVCRAMEAGLRHITHLWSSMSTVRRIGPKRHAGMLEAALVEDDLTAEIIADGYHLPTSLMRMAYRIKGPEKLAIVSDAMRASGLGPGEYEVAGLTAVVRPGDGVAMLPDGSSFAGSISTMHQCLQEVVRVVGLSLREGLQMATQTPARILRLDDTVGRLAPGRYADILLLEAGSLDLRAVYLAGERVV
jgi:N-acetylglucosamine-6-phosphate deacetylase